MTQNRQTGPTPGDAHSHAAVTLDDLAQWMQQLHNDMIDLARAVRESAPADEGLYCPPDLPWCPGGIKLMHSTVKSDKKSPEQQRDSFFHPLPQDKWHSVPGEGGSTFFAKNHPVWRREALSESEAARRGLLATEEPDRPMPPSESDKELMQSIRDAVAAAGLTRNQIAVAVGGEGALAFVKNRSLADLIAEARKVQ